LREHPKLRWQRRDGLVDGGNRIDSGQKSTEERVHMRLFLRRSKPGLAHLFRRVAGLLVMQPSP